MDPRKAPSDSMPKTDDQQAEQSGDESGSIKNQDAQNGDKPTSAIDQIVTSLIKLLLINHNGTIEQTSPRKTFINDLNNCEFHQADQLQEKLFNLPDLPRTLLQALNDAAVTDVSNFMKIYFGDQSTALSNLIELHKRMAYDSPLMLCWKVLTAKNINDLTNDELNRAYNYARENRLQQIGMSILATQAALSHKKKDYLDNHECHPHNIFAANFYKNFSAVDFSNCVISHCCFYGANFTRANLADARIHSTEVMRANFTLANLSNVISSEYFDMTDLTYANISGFRYQKDVVEFNLMTNQSSIKADEENLQLMLLCNILDKILPVGKLTFLGGAKFFTNINLFDLNIYWQLLNKLHEAVKNHPQQTEIIEAITKDLFDRITVMRLQGGSTMMHELLLSVDDFQPVLFLAYHHPLFSKQECKTSYDYVVRFVESTHQFFTRSIRPLIESEPQAKISQWLKN